MTIKNAKKTYGMELTLPVAINEDAQLEIIKDSIQELRQTFENHPSAPLKDNLMMLGNPSRYARVLRIVEEALKNAKTISYMEEK